MSFNKITSFEVKFDDFEVLDNNLIKTAGIEKTAGMKLPDGFTYDPDYLYLKVKAVSAGEYWGDNKNNDYFPEAELIAWHKTFLSAHTFKNHENKKIENAIGDVLTSEWSDKMKCVYLLIRIDRRIAPSIVRGYEKGFMTDVSMGCRVTYVKCSYCGKEAKTRFDYCEHLKTMKGKIMPNGKKVCEINIGPKFHDISVVLNGAERSAKVEGIYIHNDKVAFEMPDKGLEKTASMHGAFSSSMDILKSTENPFDDRLDEKVAVELAKKSMKEQTKKKLTKIDVDKAKTNINARVVANACCDSVKESLSSLDSIINILKLKYTDYWDKKKCIEIGQELRNIAKANGVSVDRVFCQFLKVLDFCAIELSPLEIHDIFFEVANLDSADFRRLKPSEKIKDIVGNGEKQRMLIGVPGTLSGVIGRTMSVARTFMPNPTSIGDNPKAKIRIIVSKGSNTSNVNDDFLNNDIMSKIVSGVLASRSNLSKYASPRLVKVASGEIEERDNRSHFIPGQILKIAGENYVPPEISLSVMLSEIVNNAYQNDRAEKLASGELYSDIEKNAFYFNQDSLLEKTAGSWLDEQRKLLKTTAVVFPATYSYSALQRSRVNNGEQISSLNRFIAENPGNAAAISSFLARKGIKYTPRVAEAIKKAIKAKTASNIFENEGIDKTMEDKGYTANQVEVLKLATVANYLGEEDFAEKNLEKHALSFNDIDEYLKTATSCFKIELEKSAEEMIASIEGFNSNEAILKQAGEITSLPVAIFDSVMIKSIKDKIL